MGGVLLVGAGGFPDGWPAWLVDPPIAPDDVHDRLRRTPPTGPAQPLSSHVDARLAVLDQLTDEDRATIANVIDALVTKAKLRLVTGGAG